MFPVFRDLLGPGAGLQARSEAALQQDGQQWRDHDIWADPARCAAVVTSAVDIMHPVTRESVVGYSQDGRYILSAARMTDAATAASTLTEMGDLLGACSGAHLKVEDQEWTASYEVSTTEVEGYPALDVTLRTKQADGSAVTGSTRYVAVGVVVVEVTLSDAGALSDELVAAMESVRDGGAAEIVSEVPPAPAA